MDEENGLGDKLFDFISHNFLVVGLLCAGIVFVGIGVSQMMGQKTATVEFEKGQAVEGVSAQESTVIKVDVEGQVQNPGVYSLKSDSRIQDALVAAGGLASNADRNALNLAQKVSDGQKIYVPAVGEAVVTTSIMSGGSASGAESGLISVNSASQKDLESLSGIGPVTAEKIISNRPYQALDELVSKKAIGQGIFDKIRDQIAL